MMSRVNLDCSSSYTDNLPKILELLNISIFLTSASMGKAIFIQGRDKKLFTNFEDIDFAISSSNKDNNILISTLNEILLFNKNRMNYELFKKIEFNERIPLLDINYSDNKIWFANPKYSSIEYIKKDKIEFYWKPPFINEITPTMQCGLSGLALRDNKPRYVTTLSKSTIANEWRYKDKFEGTLIDTQTDEILLDNLVLPYSPRFHQNRLFFCESGLGEVCEYDFKTKEKKTILKLPAYTHSITFFDSIMFIGYSKALFSQTKHFVPVLNFKESYSGFLLVNLKDNSIIAKLNFISEVLDIDSITILKDDSFRKLNLNSNYEKKLLKREKYDSQVIQLKREKYDSQVIQLKKEKYDLLKDYDIYTKFIHNDFTIKNVYKNINEELAKEIKEDFLEKISTMPKQFKSIKFLIETCIYIVRQKNKIVGVVVIYEEYIQKDFSFVYKIRLANNLEGGNLFLILTLAIQTYLENFLKMKYSSILFTSTDKRFLRKGVQTKIFEKYDWLFCTNDLAHKMDYIGYKYYFKGKNYVKK